MRLRLAATFAAFGLLALAPAPSRAYEEYAQGCNNCHDFFAGNPDLHDIHRSTRNLPNGIMDSTVAGRCNLCHIGTSRQPVVLFRSNGGLPTPGRSDLSCMGCHGADHGEVAARDGQPKFSGPGLRLHHASANPPVTVCANCHMADPTPFAENTIPEYYLRTDVRPKDPCNADNLEGPYTAPTTQGLDNDGDMLYDLNDPDCSTTGTVVLDQSLKCFDAVTPACVTTATRLPGDPVTYALRYSNTGTLTATAVSLTDDLSTLGPTCSVTPLQDATCVPDPTLCGGATCTITQQPTTTAAFRATVTQMPAGCLVDVTIHATVDSAATGECCNAANIAYQAPAPGGNFTTAQACFTVNPAAGCDLDKAVASVPTKTPPWLYTNACSATDTRLPGPPYITGVARDQDLLAADSLPSNTPPWELSLYQLGCSCADTIRLYKAVTGPGTKVVHIVY